MKTLGFPPELSEISKPGTRFVGYGGTGMVTTHCSYTGTGLASVTATSDGGSYQRGANWHEGESAESVYVERYTAEGREFHGYIDKVSRKLTQTG